jgi:hypothetical protein
VSSRIASDFFVNGITSALTSSSLIAEAALLPRRLCLRGNSNSDPPTDEALSDTFLHLTLHARVLLSSLLDLTNLLHFIQETNL